MSNFKILALIVSVLIFVSPLEASSPKGVDLAAMEGWDIVVDKDAIPSEKYAAKEFQRFVHEAGGVKLRIVSTVRQASKHVFIGSSQAMRSSNVGFSVEDFGDEDLRIVIRDGSIAIAGGRPRGTLYGVYTFLEDYLGVRFLTHDHTHVPPMGDWRVVGPIDRFYHPPLAFRWSALGETDNTIFRDPGNPGFGCNPHFSARIRCNTVNKTSNENSGNKDPKYGGITDRILINHTFYMQLGEEYEKSHPEYFAMIDGQRRVGYLRSQPCLTNPDVLRIVTQSLLKEIEQNPDRKHFVVAQNDNHNYCRCPKCAAIDKREGTHMGALLEFVTSVADEVAKKHPDVTIGTLAYQYSRKPPKNIKPRANVQIQLCSIEVNQFQAINNPTAKGNATFSKELADWGKISDDISIWCYAANFRNYLLPWPNLSALEPNIRFFVANNAKGIFVQGAHDCLGSEFSDLRNYVTSRLLWDPNQSGEALMDEFLNLHYGRAAPPIRRYINFIHDDIKAKDYRYNIDHGVAQAGLKAFEEALSLADDDVVRERVEKASISAYRAAIEDAWAWTWKNKDKLNELKMDPELVERTRPYAKHLFKLIDKYGVTQWAHSPFTVDKARRLLQQVYGLKENQPI